MQNTKRNGNKKRHQGTILKALSIFFVGLCLSACATSQTSSYETPQERIARMQIAAQMFQSMFPQNVPFTGSASKPVQNVQQAPDNTIQPYFIETPEGGW